MVCFAGWHCGDVWRFSKLIGEPLDEPNASGRAGYWCGNGQLGAMQYTCYAFSELGMYGRCCYGG